MFFAIVDDVGFGGAFVNPLKPSFPNPSHGIPLRCLGPVDVAVLDARPGVFGFGTVEVERGPPYPNAMLVGEGDVLPGQRPLDRGYGSLAGVEDGILPHVGPETNIPKPARSSRGGGSSGSRSALPRWGSDSKNQLPSQTTRKIGPVVFVIWR